MKRSEMKKRIVRTLERIAEFELDIFEKAEAILLSVEYNGMLPPHAIEKTGETYTGEELLEFCNLDCIAEFKWEPEDETK